MSDSDGGGTRATGKIQVGADDSEVEDVNPQLARALVAVRGMDSQDAKLRVHAALAEVHGVHAVNPGDGGKMVVDYDPSEATVMDLIRALRRIGFLAGMD